jgi:hypothetical protein
VFVVILVYYLYFSDSIWIRYDFSKVQQFSGIWNKQRITFLTYTTASRCHWLVGPETRHLPRGHDWVKPFDSVKYDVTAPRNSQITLKFDYSMRIRTCGEVESNQKIKVSERVPTPLSFNPRNLTGGELKRRRNTAHGASSVQEVRMILEGSWRSDCSPSSSCSGWSQGLSTNSSSASQNPARCCRRERRKSVD